MKAMTISLNAWSSFQGLVWKKRLSITYHFLSHAKGLIRHIFFIHFYHFVGNFYETIRYQLLFKAEKASSATPFEKIQTRNCNIWQLLHH